MRRLYLGLVLLAAAVAPLGAQAPEPESKRVSIDCHEAPLRTVLRQLFAGAAVPYVIHGRVPEVPVTIRLDDTPLEDALRVVTRQAEFADPGLRMLQEGSDYRFIHRTAIGAGGTKLPAPLELLPDAKKPANAAGVVTAALSDLDFRTVVDTICRESGLHCVVDPDIPPFTVSLRLTAVPGWSALQLMIGAARRRVPGLYLGQIGEIYVVALRPNPAPAINPSNKNSTSPPPLR